MFKNGELSVLTPTETYVVECNKIQLKSKALNRLINQK